MSDSSSVSVKLPSNIQLEYALRHAVQIVYKNGNVQELTIKRIRNAAEKNLDLEDGFFKNDATWKEKSKSIIQAEVDAHTEAEPASSQHIPHKSATPSPQPQQQSRKPQGSKRASTVKTEPRKRRRKASRDGKGVESGKAKPKRRDQSLDNQSPSEEEEKDKSVDIYGHPNQESKHDGPKVDPSDSEMSEVIDEGPKPKRNRKTGSAEDKPRKGKGPKAGKGSDIALDPDAEEIKRLQGWLVKCGIRKMWFKELAACDTSKAKIKHLKGMLADAGMTGRYSEARAEQIRVERELKADLEAVQEGDKMWGQVSPDDSGTGRPKRRLAKGLEGLDFLNDDDGEETD